MKKYAKKCTFFVFLYRILFQRILKFLYFLYLRRSKQQDFQKIKMKPLVDFAVEWIEKNSE